MNKIDEIEEIEIILGQSPPSSSFNKKKAGLPFLQGKAEFGYLYPKPINYTSKPLKVAIKDDILMSVRAPVGDVNLTPFELSIGRGLAALRIKAGDFKFFFYWFQYNVYKIEAMGMGSTFKAITGEQLRKILVPQIDVSIQKVIAQILTTVDDGIQKSDEAIKTTKRLKQGMMQKLLTEGIGHKEYKQTKIGRIPKEWEVVKLNEVTSYITDGKHGDCKNEENSGYYFISAKDIYDGRINYEKARQITKGDFLETHRRTRLEENDIVLTNSGSIAKIAFVYKSEYTNRTTFQKSVAIIKPENEIIKSEFLVYLLNSMYSYLNSIANGTSQKNLLLKDLRTIEVFLPSELEQKKIVSILKDFDKKVELEKQRKNHLQKIKTGFMNDLLSGKKSVKVN